MIEEQIQIESLSVNLERDLAANENESPTQLQKEVAEMDQQTALQSRSLVLSVRVKKSKL